LLDRLEGEEVGVAMETSTQTLFRFKHVLHNIKSCRAAVIAESAHGEVGYSSSFFQQALKAKHYLNERRVTERTFGVQLLHDSFKRQVLVSIGFQRCLAHLL